MGGFDTSGEKNEQVIQVRRCACVVKGGRRFSFGALVVVGDAASGVGVGYAKAPEVPVAVEKAVRVANRSIEKITVRSRGASKSIEHKVEAKVGASKVVILPAGAGTGLIAGAVMKSVFVAIGLTDVVAKSKGSSNPSTLVRATIAALKKLRTREAVWALRSIKVEE